MLGFSDFWLLSIERKEKARGIARLFARADTVSKLVSVKYRCQTAKTAPLRTAAKTRKSLISLVPGAGLEPARTSRSRGF